ncbi:MAG: MauE/DoxX family redox-associated membrane protein [Flavisolibacter sp.]
MSIIMRNKTKYLIQGICVMFIFLFVYAAISKLLGLDTFKIQLSQSPLLTKFAGPLAFFIPGMELVIAMLLLMERFRLVALYASFSLMVMFTSYIIAITKFSRYIPCSCGGVIQKLSWNQHLIFNTAFVIMGLAGILLYEKKAMHLPAKA